MPTSNDTDIQTLTAEAVMHSPIAAVDPAAELADVAALMSGLRIHCVVVDGVARDAHGEHLVWGIVTDLDLVRGGLEAGVRPTAGQLAMSEALCVDIGDSLETVGSLLVAHEASHVVVTAEDCPVGVISTLDIAAVLGRR